MDDIVRQAIAKWPNVPHCFGWLGLDARGNWYLRDDAVQAAGPFAHGTRQSRGSLIEHAGLVEFIQRNYDADPSGQWFFQNGPQRVYVELECAPLVWRLADDLSLTAHTGRTAHARRCVLDEVGRLYLDSELGLGLVHSQDMLRASEAIDAGAWVPLQLEQAQLPQRFGYVSSPLALRDSTQRG